MMSDEKEKKLKGNQMESTVSHIVKTLEASCQPRGVMQLTVTVGGVSEASCDDAGTELDR